MAYAAARLVVSFQTFDSDMSTDKDAVLLPSVMKAPNLRSGPTSSPTFTSWPPRTAAIPAPCPQNPATRLPPFGAPAKTWCRWHRKVPASLRGKYWETILYKGIRSSYLKKGLAYQCRG
ncbi:uncharacterized protein LOC131306587 isoform X5 [Rhododendron vialii]|uniref:uncharacterized protein LOC131306587 isoform X5 n=1 Tax=Rhododendron vialii TaxID=182163 RepID=UPI00265DCE6C|nr:uncharacterized protein LOC131306587 isoform X5 [Rhododendron vialii]